MNELSDLYSKVVVEKRCQSCRKLYYVFCTETGKDKPIAKCCVCRQNDPDYVETFQTAKMFRVF